MRRWRPPPASSFPSGVVTPAHEPRRPSPSRTARLALFAAVTLTVVWVLLRLAAGTPTGLTRTTYARNGWIDPPVERARTDRIDLDFASKPHAPRRFFSARWQGVWYLDRDGAYDLHLSADDWARLAIDGESVGIDGTSNRLAPVTRTLTKGAHLIQVDYEQRGGRGHLNVMWAPQGQAARPFEPDRLFPAAPSPRAIVRNGAIRWLGRAAGAAWIALLAVIAARAVRRGVAEDGLWGFSRALVERTSRHGRPAAMLAMTAVLLLAAALRFEAICTGYGPFDRPAWLFELEAHTRDRIGAIRPDTFEWAKIDRPYVGGDPINYIRFAREMQSFYQAHPREPVFLFATRTWLPLVDGQDVAVSFASATFSIVAVWATYLLGAAHFSRTVGVLAALGLAVDKDMATWAADGWRDDTFTAFVVLWAWVLVRLAKRPTWGWGVVTGVVGAAAVLTRITALSFVLPSLVLWLAWPHRATWVARLRAGSLAAAVCAALIAPYLINCWRTFGDPLYAINIHTGFYRARSGQASDQPMSVSSYLASDWEARPRRLIRVATQGLTTYPFSMKWVGFDFWVDGLGRVLAWLSVAGLVLMTTSWTGCMLLALMTMSLLPFAFTWTIPGGGEWRFTMHAYPFYLVACGLAIVTLGRLAGRATALIAAEPGRAGSSPEASPVTDAISQDPASTTREGRRPS